MFTIRKVLGSSGEDRIEVHHLLIDFKAGTIKCLNLATPQSTYGCLTTSVDSQNFYLISYNSSFFKSIEQHGSVTFLHL